MPTGLKRLNDKSANPATTASITGTDFTGRTTLQFGAAISPSAGVLTLGIDGNSFHINGIAQNITSIANITGSGPFFCVMDAAHIFIHAVGILETNTGANITATVGSRFRFDQDADGVTWLVTQEGAPAGTSISWLVKTSAYTAIVGDGIIADTSAGAFTVTLPAINSIGDMVSFIPATGVWETNNLTIATTAGNTIEGAASPMIADISKGFDLVAVSLTDWRLF